MSNKYISPVRAKVYGVEQNLSETEEKALVGMLYNHVSFGTTLQVFGEVGEDNVRINTMRGVLEKLLVKYNLIDTLAPENLLLLGIVSHVPKEFLEQCSTNEQNKHLQLRAQYFLKSKKEPQRMGED